MKVSPDLVRMLCQTMRKEAEHLGPEGITQSGLTIKIEDDSGAYSLESVEKLDETYLPAGTESITLRYSLGLDKASIAIILGGAGWDLRIKAQGQSPKESAKKAKISIMSCLEDYRGYHRLLHPPIDWARFVLGGIAVAITFAALPRLTESPLAPYVLSGGILVWVYLGLGSLFPRFRFETRKDERRRKAVRISVYAIFTIVLGVLANYLADVLL